MTVQWDEDDEEAEVRAFPVRLPSGARYWTVVDADLTVVPAADAFLRHVRFGRDGAESTTRSYAYSILLFLRWCERTRPTWTEGAGHLGPFMTWPPPPPPPPPPARPPPRPPSPPPPRTAPPPPAP